MSYTKFFSPYIKGTKLCVCDIFPLAHLNKYSPPPLSLTDYFFPGQKTSYSLDPTVKQCGFPSTQR